VIKTFQGLFFAFFFFTVSASAQPVSLKLKVAAVQFSSSFNVADNRDRIIQALQKLSDQGVKVAVFPECALTGYEIDSLPVNTADVPAAEEQIALVSALEFHETAERTGFCTLPSPS
jgi:hypothetical protein